MANALKILKAFGEDTIGRAKRNLGATQDRWGISSKWKNGRPTKWKRRKYRSRIVASGNLKSSIQYTIKDNRIIFSMLGYGENVDLGRKGRINAWGIGQNPSAKGAPVKAIQDWIKVRNVKPRDETGQYIKATKNAKNSMGYLINRKIKWFGQAPSHFFRDALEQSAKEYYPEIVDSVINDIFNNNE